MQKLYFDYVKENNIELYEVILKDTEYFKNINGLPFLKYFDKLGPNFNKYFVKYVESNIYEYSKSLEKEGFSSIKIQEAILHQKDFLLQSYLSILTFELCHKKVFKISDNLSSHLMNTTLDIDSTFLRLPFEACKFVYSNKNFISSYCNLVGHDVPNYECNISVFSFPISDKMKFISKLPEKSQNSLAFNIYLTKSNGELIDMFTRALPIQKGKTISDILSAEWNIDTVAHDSDENFDVDEGENFFRGLINTILYLNSNDIDKLEKLSPHDQLLQKKKELENISGKLTVKERGKVQSLQHKLDMNSTLNFDLLGESVGEIKVKKPSISKSNGYNSDQINKTFLVRGHFRSQPHGKNSRARKLIWIKPYLKGPDMGDLVEKNYSVE